MTEDGRTPPRSLQPDLDKSSSSFIITSEMNINPTRETNPTTLEYPHLSKKQTKRQIRVFATSLCHVVHTYYVEGYPLQTGRMETFIYACGHFQSTLGRASVAEAGKERRPMSLTRSQPWNFVGQV